MSSLISASVLAADFARLGAEVQAVTAAGADMIHLDIADGHFVPNISFGAAVVKAIKPLTHLPLDVHLMLSDLPTHLPAFIDAGADIITIHAEADAHVHKHLSYIKSCGRRAGMALNPATSLSVLDEIWCDIDLLLLMTVNPGFGGQSFIDTMPDKIARARRAIGARNILLSVDGGIQPTTAARATAAGANVLVAGTAIFAQPDYSHAIRALRQGSSE